MSKHHGVSGRSSAWLLGSVVLPSIAWGQTVAQSHDGAVVPASQGGQTTETVSAFQSKGLEEIVVTAERRVQNAQKAPLTIQVLGAKTLAQAGVTETTGLQKVTNGVQIGQNGGSTQIFIRGVGSFAANPLSSPGVGFNVDGVYVGRPEGTNGNFYDLARVEVLKGPQGTLYGRNATGGAINLITNDPKLGDRTAELDTEVGNYSLVHSSGYINVPIDPTAALRGAFNVVSRNGYLSDGSDDDVEQSGRIRLKWVPNDDVTFRFNSDYSHFGGKGYDYVYLPGAPGTSPYEAVTSAASNTYLHSFLPLGPLVDSATTVNRLDNTLYNFSAQLDWKLPFGTLTILPAYRHVDTDYITHFTTLLETRESADQTSVEVRLGNSSRDFTWVVGGYYYNEAEPNSIQTTRTAQFLQNYLISSSPFTTSYAAFGQSTLRVVDGFRLIGGLRYTYEDKTLSGTTDTRSTVPFTEIESFGGRLTYNNLSYKVGAEYDLAPRSLLYATYSTGFKSGGFSTVVAPNTYAPEHLNALEIGSKNRFLDNRLQVNVSAFHWLYKSIQDSRPAFDSLGNLNLVTFNSGDATLDGGSIDTVTSLTPADTLSVSGEYTHSYYNNFAYLTPAPFFSPLSSGCPASGPYAPGQALPTRASGSTVNGGLLPAYLANCAGFQVARVPEWSGTVAYNHDFTFNSGATLSLGGSVNFASARWITIDFIRPERDGAYAILDANLTYTSANGRWSAGLFGRNLAKSVYYTGGIESGVIPGLVAANIGAPQTFGARLSYRFGY